ncbi:MAG: methyltransferase domain-containing protein [Caldilineaceae bacterium]|nr:methyltransferase domain-containing protein [Caldilineaceae bacterium]
MNTVQSLQPEATRLEDLWAGDFGDAYVERNQAAGNHRQAFWQDLLEAHPTIQTVLEVGCNMGANLQWIAQERPARQLYGIDINHKALGELHRSLPQINALWGPARELPFRDRWFDLVFTMGVLIHQPESTLPLVMSEIVRCAKRYVFCGEYFSSETAEVFYRGNEGALFKRDYGRIYQELFPDLKLRAHGFLGRDTGWDDVTYWLFEKP